MPSQALTGFRGSHTTAGPEAVALGKISVFLCHVSAEEEGIEVVTSRKGPSCPSLPPNLPHPHCCLFGSACSLKVRAVCLQLAHQSLVDNKLCKCPEEHTEVIWYPFLSVSCRSHWCSCLLPLWCSLHFLPNFLSHILCLPFISFSQASLSRF